MWHSESRIQSIYRSHNKSPPPLEPYITRILLDRLTIAVESASANNVEWRLFQRNWVGKLGNASFRLDTIVRFNKFIGVIAEALPVMGFDEQFRDSIKDELTKIIIAGEYCLFKNCDRNSQYCLKLCDENDTSIKGKDLTTEGFTKLLEDIRASGSGYRPQPYRYLYAIIPDPKNALKRKIVYHRVNTTDPHLVDDEHVTFCADQNVGDELVQMTHSCLVGGSPVWMAGEMQIYIKDDLSIDVHLNDMSGHYMEEAAGELSKEQYSSVIEDAKREFQAVIAPNQPNGVNMIFHDCNGENCEHVPIFYETTDRVEFFDRYPTVPKDHFEKFQITRELDEYKTSNSLQCLETDDEQKSAVAKFKELKFSYPVSCITTLASWRGKYGEYVSESNLRRHLEYIDKNPNTLYTKDNKLYLAVETRDRLHECADEIILPQKFLFRGLANEKGSIEEFTSTSMSLTVAAERYRFPLMIIFVPNKKVHGLIVRLDGHPSGKLGTDNDCEILLTNPAMRMADEKVRDEVVQHLIDQSLMTNESFTRGARLDKVRDLIEVWEYVGYEKNGKLQELL